MTGNFCHIASTYFMASGGILLTVHLVQIVEHSEIYSHLSSHIFSSTYRYVTIAVHTSIFSATSHLECHVLA